MSREFLANVCNIAGMDEGASASALGGSFGAGDNDDVMGCLEEMAASQVAAPAMAPPSAEESASGGSPSSDTRPIPPPGIHQVPNIRIELSRHLRTGKVSAFLLGACPGLRMPAFERWLLDSKLEETRRLEAIVRGWLDDPRSRPGARGPKKKNKYGRAAVAARDDGGEGGEADAQRERERSRFESDCKLLLGVDGRITSRIARCDRGACAGALARRADRDPVLPHRPMETDESSVRLKREISAVSPADPRGRSDKKFRDDRARDVVRELCHMTAQACEEVRQAELRWGKYQKFGWSPAASTEGVGKRKRKRGAGGGGGGGGIDKVRVKLHDKCENGHSLPSGHGICSLIYTPKKRKSKRASSTASNLGDFDGARDREHDEPLGSASHQKPFVIKINAAHYRKLRTMFDSTHGLADASVRSVPHAIKDRHNHSFHAALFALAVRYSTLSGGQQLDDMRGGGMQGAIHDAVFDCLSRRFGGVGMECFASPFNATLPRFYSAFPSPDLDGHFGSCGDFFSPPEGSEDAFLQSGWYELNPPFSPGVMGAMADQIAALLEIQSQRGVDAPFVVVVPTARDASMIKSTKETKLKDRTHRIGKTIEDEHDNESLASVVHKVATKSFRQLVDSPLCRSHIVLPAGDHGYVEGGQHLRPTKYKESRYSTSVIVLRSRDWSNSEEMKSFENEVRCAFASRHTMEMEQRRAVSKLVRE